MRGSNVGILTFFEIVPSQMTPSFHFIFIVDVLYFYHQELKLYYYPGKLGNYFLKPLILQNSHNGSLSAPFSPHLN